LARAKFHPHRCNVSPLRGENPQNRPLSKLNTGRYALRAVLPVIKLQYFIVVLKFHTGFADCMRTCGASPVNCRYFITFRVSRRQRKCIVVTRVCVCVYVCVCVCLSVCLSVCMPTAIVVRPHYCTDPDVTWGVVEAAP